MKKKDNQVPASSLRLVRKVLKLSGFKHSVDAIMEVAQETANPLIAVELITGTYEEVVCPEFVKDSTGRTYQFTGKFNKFTEQAEYSYSYVEEKTVYFRTNKAMKECIALGWEKQDEWEKKDYSDSWKRPDSWDKDIKHTFAVSLRETTKELHVTSEGVTPTYEKYESAHKDDMICYLQDLEFKLNPVALPA